MTQRPTAAPGASGLALLTAPLAAVVVVRADDAHVVVAIDDTPLLHLPRRPAVRVHRMAMVAGRNAHDGTRHVVPVHGPERTAVAPSAEPVAAFVDVPVAPVAEQVVVQSADVVHARARDQDD